MDIYVQKISQEAPKELTQLRPWGQKLRLNFQDPTIMALPDFIFNRYQRYTITPYQEDNHLWINIKMSHEGKRMGFTVMPQETFHFLELSLEQQPSCTHATVSLINGELWVKIDG